MYKQSIAEDEEFMRVKAAFSHWRSERSRGRIPEQLWSQAVGLAKRYSISFVSKKLSLGWYELKKRVDSGGMKALGNNLGDGSFLEVKMADPAASGISQLFRSDCVLELRKPDGMVLKVYSNQSAPVDVENLFSKFLESKL